MTWNDHRLEQRQTAETDGAARSGVRAGCDLFNAVVEHPLVVT